MLLPELVLEYLATHVGAFELRHVEHAQHFPRDLAIFKLIFTKRAVIALGHPCLQTSFAEETFTFRTTGNILYDVYAYGAQELLNDFGIFW